MSETLMGRVDEAMQKAENCQHIADDLFTKKVLMGRIENEMGEKVAIELSNVLCSELSTHALEAYLLGLNDGLFDSKKLLMEAIQENV